MCDISILMFDIYVKPRISSLPLISLWGTMTPDPLDPCMEKKLSHTQKNYNAKVLKYGLIFWSSGDQNCLSLWGYFGEGRSFSLKGNMESQSMWYVDKIYSVDFLVSLILNFASLVSLFRECSISTRKENKYFLLPKQVV